MEGIKPLLIIIIIIINMHVFINFYLFVFIGDSHSQHRLLHAGDLSVSAVTVDECVLNL